MGILRKSKRNALFTSTGAPAPGPGKDPLLLKPTANNLLHHVLNGELDEVKKIIRTVQIQDNHEALLRDLLTNQQAIAKKGPKHFAREVSCSAWEGCFREIDNWMREWIYNNCDEIREALDEQARRIPGRVRGGELVIYDDAPLQGAGKKFIEAAQKAEDDGVLQSAETTDVLDKCLIGEYGKEQRQLPRNFLQQWNNATELNQPPPRSLKNAVGFYCLEERLGVNFTLTKARSDEPLRFLWRAVGGLSWPYRRQGIKKDLDKLGTIRKENLEAQNDFISSLQPDPSQQQRSRSPSSGP